MARIRQTILETLNARGALPVADIADAAGLSKMATRYHLRLLEGEELVTRESVAHHGTVGRPEMLYALAEVGRERLPKHYDVLAGQLLDEIAESIGQTKTRSLLQRIGRQMAEGAPEVQPGRTAHIGIQARLHRAARFLARHGYVAHVTLNRQVFALAVSSCPYRRVALAHPELCEIDVAMLRALLQLPSADMQHVRDGEGACRFEIARDEI